MELLRKKNFLCSEVLFVNWKMTVRKVMFGNYEAIDNKM